MNARQDHAPAIADTPDGPVGGVLTRGAIDGAIHAAIAGIGEDLPRRVDLARVDGLDGSHPLGHFAPGGYRLHHPNPARAPPPKAGSPPAALRQATVSSPIGPAPNTAAVSPIPIAANCIECSATDRGS